MSFGLNMISVPFLIISLGCSVIMLGLFYTCGFTQLTMMLALAALGFGIFGGMLWVASKLMELVDKKEAVSDSDKQSEEKP